MQQKFRPRRFDAHPREWASAKLLTLLSKFQISKTVHIFALYHANKATQKGYSSRQCVNAVCCLHVAARHFEIKLVYLIVDFNRFLLKLPMFLYFHF